MKGHNSEKSMRLSEVPDERKPTGLTNFFITISAVHSTTILGVGGTYN